jgi:hypothetical protein
MSSYEELQPDDDDIDSVVGGIIESRRERVRREGELSREAYARQLIRTIERALTGEADPEAHPDDMLAEIVRIMDEDERFEEVLLPTSGCPRWAAATLKRFKSVGETPNRERLFQAIVHAARELGYLGGYADKSRYAPVVMEALDIPGASSDVQDGEQSPIGRRRLRADSTTDLEDAQVEIPHKDCEHIMILANPRQGKDSTACRICGNLKREHGYKWISLYDDGRNETPMIALPNQDPAINDVLDEFEQEPRGYQTTVYVPATSDLPDELPANHEPFSIGLDQLSPGLVAQLAGEEISSEATERRIRKSLEEARAADGSVETLISKLQTYADETTAEVQVRGLKDDDAVDEAADEEDATHSYHMGEDELLANIAESLMLLAGEGLLTDAGAETNLDMAEVISDQDSAAVLNANFVSDSLKYLLTDLWLQLIYRARDEQPHLPRVALEVRELKDLAPSKLGDSSHSHIVKSLQQTFFFLSSQGGSRRILVVGSTQKLNDVYKPVRGNMPIKILLQLGPEKISTLETSGYSFSHEQRDQLQSFQTGWGMILNLGEWVWPIQWCGAQCALGLGDIPWRDRYGRAAGFRVSDGTANPETWYQPDGSKVESRSLDVSEWYLTGDDVAEAGSVGAAREERRDDRVPSELLLEEVDVDEGRELELLSQQDARERLIQRIEDKHGRFPDELASWLDYDLEQVDKFLDVLRSVRDGAWTSYDDIGKDCGHPSGTIGTWKTRGDDPPLEGVIDKGEIWFLRPPGEFALQFPWRDYLD